MPLLALPWALLHAGLKHVRPLCAAVKTMLRGRLFAVAPYGPTYVGMRA